MTCWPEPDHKVVYVCDEYPGVAAQFGGIGSSIRLEAEWFASNNFAVHVVCASPDGMADPALLSGVRVHLAPGRVRMPKLRALSRRLSIAQTVASVLGHSPGIVIASDYCGPFCTRPFRQKLLIQLHGSATVNTAAYGRKPPGAVRYFERRTVELADAFQSCSHFTAQRTAEVFPLGSKPVAVIPNSVDVRQFHPESGNVARADIIFVGKFATLKGIFTLAEAIPAVLRAVTEARLLIVGADTVEQGRSVKAEFLRRVPSEYRSRICFLGRLPRTEVASVLRRASVLVLPSLVEAAPMVVLEAMASGRPVVASRRGGIPEIVADKVTGLLADPAEPRSFSDALLRIVRDPGLAASMGAAARTRAIEVHAPESVYTRTLAFHRQLLGAA
ncbi:MAG TPA: glycosyltransferase family 4 protein [Bryobacteraceae bacterium]|nr:glycosyltransferase family 4 protein [Bryobacteraceae bacterium]